MTTQTVEFTTLPHDGVIDLPKELQNLSNQRVRVILLLNNAPKAEPRSRQRFPDLTAFRNCLPPAQTSAAELIRSLRDENDARY